MYPMQRKDSDGHFTTPLTSWNRSSSGRSLWRTLHLQELLWKPLLFSPVDWLLISIFFCLYCSLTNFVRPSPSMRPSLVLTVHVWFRLLSCCMKYTKNNLLCHLAGSLLINNDHFRSQPTELCKAIFSEAFISRFLWTALIYHGPYR